MAMGKRKMNTSPCEIKKEKIFTTPFQDKSYFTFVHIIGEKEAHRKCPS